MEKIRLVFSLLPIDSVAGGSSRGPGEEASPLDLPPKEDSDAEQEEQAEGLRKSHQGPDSQPLEPDGERPLIPAK